MKRILIIMLFIASVIYSYADNTFAVYARSTNAHYIDKNNYRETVGGTHINPIYVGTGFSETMKGAFEYACKLVEEKMPTTFPINVSVEFSNLNSTVSSDCLALVEAVQDTIFGVADNRIHLKRYFQQYGVPDFLQNDAYDLAYIKDGIDARIKFNNRKPFSYTLNTSDIPSNKYDFITVTIQALLKAFGFACTAYSVDNMLYPTSDANTYTRKLLSFDYSRNYIFATSGNARMRNWSLYSTPPYRQGVSLCYFADSSDDETAIMQYGIAPGSYIRHIGSSIDDFFEYSEWGNPIAVGNMQNNVESAQTTDVIPFAPFTELQSETTSIEGTSDDRRYVIANDFYYYIYDNREFSEDGSYVMLKNGCWQRFNSLSALTDYDNYARTGDGYLRIKNIISSQHGSFYNTTVSYHLYDYIPQKPEASMNSFEIVPYSMESNSRRAMLNSTHDDVDFIDVKIGFKNTEGTTSIMVEQTDMDYPHPYRYYIDDISSGEFIAYMTLGYPSLFKLTYFNSNGSTTGEQFMLDPSDEVMQTRSRITTDIANESIRYLLQNPNNESIKFTITDVKNGRIIKQGMLNELNGSIDISSFGQGTFVLSVFDSARKIAEKKWRR